MKRFAFIIVVLAVVLAGWGFRGQHAERLDVSGMWRLDLRESENLPKSFQMVESFTMSVAQSEDSVVLVTTMTGGGQTMTFPRSVYRFDGSEVFREDTLRSSRRWIKAAWATTGQKMIVTQRVEQGGPGPGPGPGGSQPVRYTETDVWQKGRHNMLLVLVTQKYAGNDSTRTEKRYYRRVQ